MSPIGSFSDPSKPNQNHLARVLYQTSTSSTPSSVTLCKLHPATFTLYILLVLLTSSSPNHRHILLLADLDDLIMSAQPSPDRRGLFIVLEGLDRSGKSTQVALLEQGLRDAGRKSKTMKFPGWSITLVLYRVDAELNRMLRAHIRFTSLTHFAQTEPLPSVS